MAKPWLLQSTTKPWLIFVREGVGQETPNGTVVAYETATGRDPRINTWCQILPIPLA